MCRHKDVLLLSAHTNFASAAFEVQSAVCMQRRAQHQKMSACTVQVHEIAAGAPGVWGICCKRDLYSHQFECLQDCGLTACHLMMRNTAGGAHLCARACRISLAGLGRLLLGACFHQSKQSREGKPFLHTKVQEKAQCWLCACLQQCHASYA